MPEVLRIFLADDHAVVREGLKTLVNAQKDMVIIGEANNGCSAVECAIALQPDVVIMDISMPALNGVEATLQLKRASPQVKVLTLTVHEDKSYLRQVMEAGASGLVLKRAAAGELIQAIRAVAAGGTYIDPALAAKLFTGVARGSSAAEALRKSALSEREEDVLRLVAQGYSNKEIARRMDLSVKTIETYKARSLEKLGLESRVDIIRLAMQRGWLQELDPTPP